ncbi:CHAP domain-containing protein [Actinoplanes sp. ATCC 53533]|uniref:CHAP domain-containing protein n=1 Tax=Actinoplanes sp. ATCC 53533 TaxID=1288362 RepID=UPI001315861D|nr:CHAP domain-containing protein [Actinoplanes sp. ATCC 53533]
MVLALSVGAVAAGTGYDLAGGATGAYAATRDDITRVANAEVGYAADANQCNKYASLCDDWCAMFTNWVWRTAGVSPVPDSFVATAVGQWGVARNLFKPRPPNSVGDPQPGDIAVYGAPGSGQGGHVSIVFSVDGGNRITTIDGNYSNRVAKRQIDATTATAGSRDVRISGYVTPPNVTAGGRGAHVVISGMDNALYHEMRLPGGQWTGFQPLNGSASRVSIAAMPDGTAQAVVIGQDGVVYHEGRHANGQWTGFQPIPGNTKAKDVAIAALPDNTSQVAIVGDDDIVHHQGRHANGQWTGFQPIPGNTKAKSVSIAGLPDNTSQILITGDDDVVYHQGRHANGQWTGFQPLTGNTKAKDVTIAGLPDRSSQVVIVGDDDIVYHQGRYPNGQWTGFQPLNGMGTTTPAKAKRVSIAGLPDSTSQILITGLNDDVVYHQLRNPNGQWTGFQPLNGMGTTTPAKATDVAIG